MPTRTLTIRGVADATLRRLRRQAADAHRSLNGQLLAILEAASVPADADAASPSVLREPATAPYPAATPPLADSVDADALAEVCRRHQITWLALFGSQARGDALPRSDVDVVVDFAPGKTPGFGIVRVAAALRPVFGGRRVDLVTRRGLSPRMRAQILTSVRPLYAE